MKISGALVFGEDRKFIKRDIYINEGQFTEEASDFEQEVDASCCYAIPGLVDIHFHGALGYDVCDCTMEAFENIARYEARNGITAICPATLTLPVEELKSILALGARFAEDTHPEAADIVGFNMEGPFVGRTKLGAQNETHIRKCDRDLVDEFYKSSKGLLKIIGLAPEDNPDFEQYISDVKSKVTVSLAHTGADYATAKRAIDAGADHAVHLYNAMSGLDHKDPGVVGAVFDSERVTAEIICDGIHVHPAAVRTAFKVMGAERMILISDSLRCTGMPDGEYTLGGRQIIRNGNRCTLAKGGNIAGSVSNLMDCMRRAVLEMGIPLEEAVAAATINPAIRIGVDHKYGAIKKGNIADVVLLNKKDLSLQAVYKNGFKII